MRRWAFAQQKAAIASLNKDEIFWLFIQHHNDQFKERNMPLLVVPNLGLLNKLKPGTNPQMEIILHHRIIEFIFFLAAPVMHKKHWEDQQWYLPWLIQDYPMFAILWEKGMKMMFKEKRQGNIKFVKDALWQCYLEKFFQPYVDQIINKFLKGFPACEAETFV